MGASLPALWLESSLVFMVKSSDCCSVRFSTSVGLRSHNTI